MGAGESADILIIGAGAAGLMAGIWAGRTFPEQQIVILDSARKLGAKILVSGGGRCNVTHDQVDASAYSGSSPHAINKVLRRFDVSQTIAFFRELGVSLKREETGKLFPVSDSARTVLAALVTAVTQTNTEIIHPRRVEKVVKQGEQFHVSGAWGTMTARRLIIATGGCSLPKSGSDGHGYALAQSLGHSLTRTFPALVPLTLPQDHFIRQLSGVTLPATLKLWSGSGKQLAAFTDSTLCTHFGLSGPSVLDISRHFIAARFDDPAARLTINWLPHMNADQLDEALQNLGRMTPLNYLRRLLPDRLAQALCTESGVAADTPGDQLRREVRLALVQAVTNLLLPIAGDRGYNYAEVTAGGVPLAELNLKTMESRRCPGLFLCGEICDVDGRIGGYNFQWAWASGYTAGISVGV
ncbi:MAG: NAD(P)/FAD-dependent oxidoreductase [Ardenticatenaceae bacterium]|nr:NAD(P)/FAD-dependent oxidoreductase [Ardenticatenaceae bacterium]MCB9444334.1 NAD(P)/FAD-dependent oxidoreductase [Ardenticatenaceae bacterium]